MDSSKIKAIIIVVLAAFAALYLGISAATAQVEAVSWIIGGTTITVCILLGRRIWLLIPFMGVLGLTFRIPGQPTSLLLAQCLFLTFSSLLLLMRRLPYRLRFSELEIWTLLLVLMVLQVYFRNPVGVSIFGGDTVGGRPYAIFGITVLTSLFLFGLAVTPKDLALVFRLTVLGGILNFILFSIGFFVPKVGMLYGAVSGFESNSPGGTNAAGPERASRIGFVGVAAKNFSLWVCCKISPLRAVLHPLWLALIIVSLAFAAWSGYRNTVAAVGLTYICGILYRGGGSQLIASIIVGVSALVLLALVNSMAPLPLNIQRSLSFLPGTWSADVKLDASQSTEWRTELWKEVLFTDRWINNKVLGDGLGFTKKELQTQMDLATKTGVVGISGFDVHRETILSNADYHSGPVQTIRTIGYVGLVILLVAMIRLAVHAHRQILRCRNTEWYPLALLIGIPLIWAPIFFTFIFGSFQIGATGFLLGAAMVRLLQNNLPLPTYQTARTRRHTALISRQSARSSPLSA